MALRYNKDLNLNMLRLSNELSKNPQKKYKKILKHKVRLKLIHGEQFKAR